MVGFFRTSKYYSVLQVHLRRILSIITSVIQLRLMLEDRAGGGVDLVAVRHAAGLELHLAVRGGFINVIHGKDDLLHLELNNS